MNILAILGRQPELSIAELEGRFGAPAVEPFSDTAALVETDEFDVQHFGGIQKAGRIIAELEPAPWDRLSRDVVRRYARELKGDGKLTLGISVYGRRDITSRDVGRTGLALKQALKKAGRSVRLVPNDDTALSTATTHHNKLGLSANKLELIVVYGRDSVVIAESIGSQNISALAARDQGRPKRDAFVGMLPPKLALMMINMSGITQHTSASATPQTILDPFCGTGVVLQEAALRGFNVYGTDLAEKMVDYTKANMEWLGAKYSVGSVLVEPGDAIEHHWQQPVDAVVAETYLGQPFSAPPAADKLEKVVRVVDHIVSKFLENLGSQIAPGTPLCLAVPAWRDGSGRFTFLPTVRNLSRLGYAWQPVEHTDPARLVYFREDQVVARQLLIITKV